MAAELGVMSGGGERTGRLFAWVDIPPEDVAKIGVERVQELADTGRVGAAALCVRLECAIGVRARTSAQGASVDAECNGLICTPANNNSVIAGFCAAARYVLGGADIAIVENGPITGSERLTETSTNAD
ncbi:hypothetical protein EYC59_05770 [Candidatus Saccharibacteria bacterium]|nr:MAG: hypothetical protein EYC59_05770 [Candidatus Saccharibacteria bacterium]